MYRTHGLPYAPDIRPERSYPSETAITAWARVFAFGGAWTKTYEQDQQKIIVAFRSFTSGVESTDLSFFVQDGDQWKLVLWYPVRGENLQIEQQEHGLQVYTYDYKQKKKLNRLFISYDALFRGKD